MNCRNVRKIMDEWFLGRPPSGRDHQALSAHVQNCPSCSEYRQKVGCALEAMGDAAVDEFLGSIPAMPLPAQLPAAEKQKPSWLPALFPAAGWAAAAVLGAALGLVLFSSPEKTGFLVRGKEDPFDRLGVRLFCVEVAENSAPSVKELEAGSGCPIEAVLMFSYSQPYEDRQVFLVLYARQQEKLMWYYPQSPDGQALALEAGSVDQVLPRGVRLAEDHRPGKLIVEAVFVSKPVRAEDAMTDDRGVAKRFAVPVELLNP